MTGQTPMHAPIAGMDNMLGFNLRIAQLHFFDAFYRDFSEAGITPAEYSILTLLAHSQGMRQGELAARLKIKRSNMTKLMRSLEARGLVRRSTPDDDGRALDVELSPAGADLQRKLAQSMPDHDAAAASRLSFSERQRLLELLRKLTGKSHAPAVDMISRNEEELAK